MSIDFAHLTIHGRLTDDPEMGTTKTGTTYCRFRVASNRRVGKDQEKTCFVPVTVFGSDAVNSGKFLTKGRSVMVTGDFETDSYEDREGNKRKSFGVVARSVIFGSGGRDIPDENPSSDNRDDSRSRERGGEYIRSSRGRGYDQGR